MNQLIYQRINQSLSINQSINQFSLIIPKVLAEAEVRAQREANEAEDQLKQEHGEMIANLTEEHSLRIKEMKACMNHEHEMRVSDRT